MEAQQKEQLNKLIDDLGLAEEEEATTPSESAGASSSQARPRSDKLRYVDPSDEDVTMLTKTLRNLLKEGHGETIVTIGASEDGKDSGLTESEMGQSLATLARIAKTCESETTELRVKKEANGTTTTEMLVRVMSETDDFIDVRVAVCGNVDAGKSTLLGVLTHCELDNGRGKSRAKVFRHKHELESGRTSCVSTDILGFDVHGNITNKPSHDGSLDWLAICTESAKVITFIDLAGHEKYLKTTVFGLTGHAPDYVMLMIGANAGIIGMTKEHLGLALALNVPVFIVVTKVDMCPANILEATMKLLLKMLKSPGCRKVPMLVSSPDDVLVAASNFVSERICPIFQVSNVTGEHIDTLKMFLNLLTPRTPPNDDLPVEFQIDETFAVPGVGTVVSGTTLQGTIRVNDTLLLGPDPLGQFLPVNIKGIHRRRMPTSEVRGGQTASLALKKIKRNQIRKGMVMLAPSLKPHATWQFQADIVVLHHPTTISAKYQAMVHCGAVRQTASIVSMDADHLRTGDRTSVTFRFMKHPEYIRVGSKIIFREGRTKAVGTITGIDSEAPASDKSSHPASQHSHGHSHVGASAASSASAHASAASHVF